MVQRKLDGAQPLRPSSPSSTAAGRRAQPAPAPAPKPQGAGYQADSLVLRSSGAGARIIDGAPAPSDEKPSPDDATEKKGGPAPVGPNNGAKPAPNKTSPGKPAADAKTAEGPAAPPPLSPAQAIADTDKFFVQTTSLGTETSGMTSRRLERDLYESSENAHYITLQGEPLLKAQAPLIAQRMAQLPEGQRQQVESLRKLVEKEPLGNLALNMLLLREPSPLFEGPLNQAQQGLLDALTQLASDATPLIETIGRSQLTAQLLREVAYPTGLTQSSWGTCTVSTMQILTAMKDPAEYVRLITGLASPEGKVTMRGGDTILRSPGSEKPVEKSLTTDKGDQVQTVDQRSISTRLFAVALMEYANGPDVTYDYVKDEHSDTQKSGLSVSQANKVLEELTQRDSDLLYKSSTSKEEIEERIQQALGQNIPVPVAFEWGGQDDVGKIHSSHMVLITRKDSERTYYANPWGKEESISEADFQERLISVSVPKPAKERSR